jgi:methylmalonyl-CoA mutase
MTLPEATSNKKGEQIWQKKQEHERQDRRIFLFFRSSAFARCSTSERTPNFCSGVSIKLLTLPGDANDMEDFKTINFSDWEVKARKDLKTEEAYRNLYSSWDGLTISPYYDQSGISPSSPAFYDHFSKSSAQGTPRGWFNLERVEVISAKKANATSLQALMNGAEGIHFIINEACDASELLQDILPQFIYLAFTITDLQMADNLRSWLDNLNIDHDKVHLYISMRGKKRDYQHYVELFNKWPGIRFLHYHLDQDSDQPVEDLANILQNISETFGRLTGQGLQPDELARELVISAGIGPKFFQEIVRLRALRILVYKLCRAWGADLAPEDLLIHAISEPWIREEFQPQGNMIKSATAGMAGILGGANLLTVLPEDSNSELQRRIARNVGTILREESYLDKTRDAISGAYYIESLTDDLARKTWSEFQNRMQA